MKYFQKITLVFIPVLLVWCVSAQRLDDALATSTKMNFTAASLSQSGQKVFLDRHRLISETRTNLLSGMIANSVLEIEAKSLNTTTEKLLAAQRAKIVKPTAVDIQMIYNANRATLGGRPLEEVRAQIIEYLEHDSEQKLVDSYIQNLRTKYKVTLGKEVNSVGLTSPDAIATVNGRVITLGEFELTNKVRLNDAEVEIFDEIRTDLEASIFSALAAEEAKERNLDTGAFIAAEITDKLRLFTDAERANVERALMKRLFAKYNVKILLQEPTPVVQNILVESDDPQSGSVSAPVTVVMFTDFQCPACSATHPVLRQTLAEYGDKIRFVIRDFPLENIHENAFTAALAANAARAQGKFLEYVEVLYRNQHALDKASLSGYAADLGLNAKQFELDFTDAKNRAEVMKDQADGRTYGIGGTPTIFVNGVKVQRLSADAFRRAVDRALSK